MAVNFPADLLNSSTWGKTQTVVQNPLAALMNPQDFHISINLFAQNNEPARTLDMLMSCLERYSFKAPNPSNHIRGALFGFFMAHMMMSAVALKHIEYTLNPANKAADHEKWAALIALGTVPRTAVIKYFGSETIFNHLSNMLKTGSTPSNIQAAVFAVHMTKDALSPRMKGKIVAGVETSKSHYLGKINKGEDVQVSIKTVERLMWLQADLRV